MHKRIAYLFLAGFLLCSCSHRQTSKPGARLAWHNRTLVDAYNTVGNRNPKWDESARNALKQYAEIRADQGDIEMGAASVGYSVQDAMNAGCDDPLIRYLYCRFAPDHSSKPLAYWQDQFRKAAQDMENSGYSPLLKFFANDRTANALWQQRDHSLWNEITQHRRAAMGDLVSALQDTSLPVEEIEPAIDLLLDTIGQNDQECKDAYDEVKGPLFKNWPDTSAAYYVKGRFYYRFAWQARGGGYANSVSPEAWQSFSNTLVTAETAYRKAWSLNPKDARVATQMIEMAVSQQKDRTEMELWFQRAMDLDTNNYEACTEKLRYLRPEWYGSREDMIAFGRECVASPKWGGHVPLTLVDARSQAARGLEKEQQDAYWQQPEVWTDIQSAYEKFFRINPDANTSPRYPYAWYAFRCGQWQDFKAQIKIIRDTDLTVNTAYFGGEDEFNKLVERADRGN